tara:strand:+ start:1154 stop:1351 length:198 start_codon:yes stop_codon:yes gene_type:complete
VTNNYYKKFPNKVSLKDLKKMTDKEFDEYCSKIIKQLCKSMADDLDFYDFKKNPAAKVGALNENN